MGRTFQALISFCCYSKSRRIIFQSLMVILWLLIPISYHVSSITFYILLSHLLTMKTLLNVHIIVLVHMHIPNLTPPVLFFSFYLTENMFLPEASLYTLPLQDEYACTKSCPYLQERGLEVPTLCNYLPSSF